eukprot:scaffold6007_cov183-Amphora_coffeaeformis.AAC.11
MRMIFPLLLDQIRSDGVAVGKTRSGYSPRCEPQKFLRARGSHLTSSYHLPLSLSFHHHPNHKPQTPLLACLLVSLSSFIVIIIMDVIKENETESYSEQEDEEECKGRDPTIHEEDDAVNRLDPSSYHKDEDDTSSKGVMRITGVLYGRSVRSGYACLHLYQFPSSSETTHDDNTDDDKDDHSLGGGDAILIRLQFATNTTTTSTTTTDSSTTQQQPVQLRSHIRRFCKPGDLLAITVANTAAPASCKGASHGTGSATNTTSTTTTTTSQYWKPVSNDVDTQWQDLRLVLDLTSVVHAQQILKVQQRRYWTIAQVQACQQEFCGRSPHQRGTCFQEDPTRLAPLVAPPLASSKTNNNNNNNNTSANGGDGSNTPQAHHNAGGLLKRTQGEYLKNFLAHMIIRKLNIMGENDKEEGGKNDNITGDEETQVEMDPTTTTWAVTNVSPHEMQRVRNYINQGTGVLDVAGGSGHVSMALGLDGIQSTIVDPRDKVGKLPGRDRKVWNRAWKQQSTPPPNALGEVDEHNNIPEMYCQPVQYKVYRAWFGKPPEVRHDDQNYLPVCGGDGDEEGNRILSNCRAIAALHPDEATDAIVDTAVERRIPFVIVPCCVFYRLFPHRRMPRDADQPVSTYEDLLDYLQAKDESIQRTRLPFEGANTLLWSIF